MIAKYAIALTVLILLAAAFAWAFLPARYLPGNRARHLRIRLHLRLHPGKGFAHVFSLWLRWGRLAALRRSGRIRAALPLWYRIADPRQHSVFLGRAHYRHGLRVPLEEHLLVMAPPRTYKTAFLADVILRYPGPVIATTTKADIYHLTAAVRAQHGPVHVFNPQHIGGVASTFCWSPVDGCEDPATAIRRADAFAFAVSQKGVEDGTFWSAKACDYLRGYFHAAALARYDLRTVAAWVAGADPDVPERILLAAGARQWALTLAELRSEAHKTAATVRMVMSRALSFMADPALAASVLPGPGDGFDIPAFLDDAGTVYLIAEAVSEEAPVAPLFAAMATEIHYIAAQLGQASPAGRLDPPLLMGLDEVTQICPVPLPFWLSDSGGKGIQVFAVVHGEAQLAGRWGDHGRQVVLDTSSVKVFLPGITDTTTLQAASTLCGQASWKVRGQDHATRHDVATPDMIRQLPAGFALVIRGGCAPVIARLPRAWNNPAYRRARRLGQAPWHAAAELPATDEDPEPGIPDHVPADWLPGNGTPPSPGADHDRHRPDHRHRRPARRPRRAAHPARHPRSRPSRRPQRTARRAHRPGRQHRPGRSGARCRPRPPHRTQPDRPRPRRLPPGPGTGLVEADRRRPPRTGHPAAGLGRAGLPARLRAPGRRPRPLLALPRPVPVRPGHPGRAVVGAVPAARPQPRPALRPGRIPGPHPARPRRPAPHRDQPLRPPPQPRTSRRPALEHAMTGATLRQALAYAARGWPVFPCHAGQKIPATRHGYLDATTDPAQITAWFARHPRPQPGHRHRRTRTRRPGRRPARPGRQRVRRLRQAQPRRAARRRRRLRPHAQRRPARLLPRLRPAQRPPARPPPGLPLPRRLRPGPALPGRRQALPAHPHRGRRRRPGLGRRHRAAGTPAAAARPQPHPDPGRDLSHLARWVASQREGNRNAGLFWAANRALDADPAADLSPLAAAARQAGLDEREITRTLDSARNTGQPRPPAPDHQAEAAT